MIRNFRHKGLEKLFVETDGRRLPANMRERIENILGALQFARSIDDLARPAFRLHPLKGNLKGFWSVTVRANWRIVFRFEDGEVYDVDFLDYH